MTSKLRAFVAASRRRNRHKVALIATALLTVFIAYVTLAPISAPHGLPGSDKTYHVLAFVLLTFPCAILYPKALIVVIPGAIAFGGLIEIVQPSFGREREIADLYADAVGTSIGAAAGLCIRALVKRWA